MDPMACWKGICTGLQNPDEWEEVVMDCLNLASWLKKGGFASPRVPSARELTEFAAVLEKIRRESNYHVNPDMD